MKFLEFIFCFVFKRYQKWGEKDIAGVYALCVISALQLFNIFTILLTGLFFNLINIRVVKNYYVIIAFISLLLFNYYYFFIVRGVKCMFNNYMKGNDNIKLKIQSFIYLVLTFTTFLISLLIYIYIDR